MKIYKRKKAKVTDIVFDTVVYIILILLCIVTVVPFLQVVTISLSPGEIVSKYGLHLFPTKITLEGYMKVFKHDLIWTSYGNTIVRVVLGTSINVLLLVLGAYPLSKKYLPDKKFWTAIIIFTMYFSGGLIPTYLLITKVLHMKDSMLALVLPPAVSAYTLIIVRNFFMAIPDEMEESAKMDGASDFRVLFSIIVPLSKPVLATVALWGVVFHWNSWFDCMLYIGKQNKFVLQYVLRQVLIEGQVQDMNITTGEFVNTETMKMATLVVSILPIICIYPFLQKYFVKGVMIGAVKG